jgi:hypothetical protein
MCSCMPGASKHPDQDCCPDVPNLYVVRMQPTLQNTERVLHDPMTPDYHVEYAQGGSLYCPVWCAWSLLDTAGLVLQVGQESWTIRPSIALTFMSAIQSAAGRFCQERRVRRGQADHGRLQCCAAQQVVSGVTCRAMDMPASQSRWLSWSWEAIQNYWYQRLLVLEPTLGTPAANLLSNTGLHRWACTVGQIYIYIYSSCTAMQCLRGYKSLV